MQAGKKPNKVMAVFLVVSMLFAYSLFFERELVQACYENPLTACIKVDNYWKKDVKIDYNWKLDKEAKPDSITLNNGENKNINYTLTAERDEKQSVAEKKGATATVTVNNPTCNGICGYTVEVQLQKKNGCSYVDIGKVDRIKVDEKLNGNSSKNFEYYYTDLQEGTTYRVKVTINYDYKDNNFTQDFCLPSKPTTTNEIKNAEAKVTDAFDTVPDGFTVSGGIGGDWVIKEADLVADGDKKKATKTYMVNVKNISAQDGKTFTLKNTATLTEKDSGCTRKANAGVSIIVPQANTTLLGCVTASGQWTENTVYDWTIEKKADPVSVVLNRGETEAKTIDYTLTAKRNVASSCSVKKIAEGKIKVINNGLVATKGLKIVVQLQEMRGSGDIDVGAPQTITPSEQLLAGKEKEYPFSINYDFAEGKNYRVRAVLSADNQNEAVPIACGKITIGRSGSTTDAEATVVDQTGNLTGFDVTSEFKNVWEIKEQNLTADGSVMKATKTYKVTVKNISAQDGKTFTLKNTATLTEKDSGCPREANAEVSIIVPQANLALCGSVTATSEWTEDTVYDWTIEKEAKPTSLLFKLGETKTIDYTLTAKRNVASSSFVKKAVNGVICVTNTSRAVTKGLKITLQLQEKGLLLYGNVGSPVTITPAEQLEAGELKNYDFGIYYQDLADGKKYRVKATITADNLEKQSNAESNEIIATPVITKTDAEATVEDDFVEINKVTGFTLEGGLENDWEIKEGDLTKDGEGMKTTKKYTVNVTNKEAEGDQTFTLKNEATITEKNSGQKSTATAQVVLETELNSTTLNAGIKANSYWNRGTKYDWTIEKKVNPDYLRFKSRSSQAIDYTLIATRMLADEDDDYGIKGTITVENTGKVPTENLEINVWVEYNKGDGYKVIPEASEKIKPTTQIAAKSAKGFDYSIAFDAVKNADYRVVAEVTVTNYDGKNGQAAGIEEKKGFSLPKDPNEDVTDATAVVTDEFNVPDGFKLTGELKDDWEIRERDLTKSGSKWTAQKTYTVTLKNESARYNNTYELLNTANLKESDTHKLRKDDAKVSILVKKSSSSNPPSDPPKEKITPPTDPIPYTPPAPPTPPTEPEPKLPYTGGDPAAFITFGMSLVAYGSWLRFKK